MKDDPISRARAALQDAAAVLPSVNGDTAALTAALDRVAEALENIGGLESRLAAQQSLLDDRLMRVENNRLFRAWNTLVTRASRILRRPVAPPVNAAADYAIWVAHEQAGLPDIDQARATSKQWQRQPLFSVITSVRTAEQAEQTLASLRNQSYRNFEFCVGVDPGSAWAGPFFEEPASQVTVRRTDGDAGRAASMAAGEYLLFAPPGAAISPFALHYLAESLQDSDYELLYADEDEIDSSGTRRNPKFKPDWSPALLRECMYIGSPLVISRRRFVEMGGFAGQGLHDLALRATGRNARVHHIGRVLCHTTTGNNFAATSARTSSADAMEMTAIICSKSPGLLAACLQSLRATAAETVPHITVICHEESGPNPELRRVIDQFGAVPVSYTGTFNFSRMNNLGAAHARTAALLFLNDDVRATAPGWAERLAGQLAVEPTGIAGAVLWYPSGVLQHAGIVTGIHDGVGHAGRYMRFSELWPWLLLTRNVSAVTGACLAIRTDLFQSLGGFDAAFPNNYNDVDLCLRARTTGREVVCVNVPGLVHAECQTRRGVVQFEERYAFFRRWGVELSRPDPYYSGSLSPTETIRLNTSGESGYRHVLAKYQG